MNSIVHNSICNRDDIPLICRETLECIGTLDSSLDTLCEKTDVIVEKYVGIKRSSTSMSSTKKGKQVKEEAKSNASKRKKAGSIDDDIDRSKSKTDNSSSSGGSGFKKVAYLSSSRDKDKKDSESKTEEELVSEQIGTFKDMIENISARKITLATRAYDYLDHAVKCVDEDIRMIERAMKLNGHEIPISDEYDSNGMAIIGKKKELEPVYCTCRNIAHGDMISCDNEKCNIEWFHFACVGLTKLPKGDWFCKVCKANMRSRL